MNSILKKIGKHYTELTVSFFNLYKNNQLTVYGTNGKTLPGKVEGLPEEDEDRKRVCSLMAILQLLSMIDSTPTVKAKIDELYAAVEIVMIAMTAEEFQEAGLVTIDYGKEDEYGFPVMTMNQDQREQIKSILAVIQPERGGVP